MPLLHAIVLGLVQGLSEFLPISSSGHLELVPWLFGWDDFSSTAIERAFDVAVHLGTLAGAVAYFRTDLARYLRAGLQSLSRPSMLRDLGAADDDTRIAWLLVMSSIPAALVGVVLGDALQAGGEQHALIGALLITFGLVLLVADRLGGTRTAEEWTWRGALAMGAAQSLALQPGVSRSGVTITTGRWLGLSRDAAARLSFLMSVPVIVGAGLKSGLDLRGVGGLGGDLAAPFALAMITSAATGYAAVWGTLRLVRTRSFSPFVIYRVIVGAVVIVVAATGWR